MKRFKGSFVVLFSLLPYCSIHSYPPMLFFILPSFFLASIVFVFFNLSTIRNRLTLFFIIVYQSFRSSFLRRLTLQICLFLLFVCNPILALHVMLSASYQTTRSSSVLHALLFLSDLCVLFSLLFP